MPAFAAKAPGKAILFGEHAVVYGRPAIAVPVQQVQAHASVTADVGAPRGRVWIEAPDIGLDCALDDLPSDSPFTLLAGALRRSLAIDHFPALRLHIHSTIPVAAGLGSGAAVSVASIRALAAFCGRSLPDAEVSALAYQVEQKYHGTPSGIDNTVIAYAQPVYFVRGQPFELLRVGRPFQLVIGDSGVASPTAAAVGGVRQRWQAGPARYEALFDRVAAIVSQARVHLEAGQVDALGPLLDADQAALQEMGVSSPKLERLAAAARAAGALGAKLSGGGLGGNMIALAPEGLEEQIAQALTAAGAVRTIVTTVI
jgi:mevalonate kinase